MGHSADEEQSWIAPLPPQVAMHEMVTLPIPKPEQQTCPLLQSAALEQDCMMLKPPSRVGKGIAASLPPELDPVPPLELDPVPPLELDPPLLLELSPLSPLSPLLLLLVDPPQAAASAAPQVPMNPTKRSLLMRIDPSYPEKRFVPLLARRAPYSRFTVDAIVG